MSRWYSDEYDDEPWLSSDARAGRSTDPPMQLRGERPSLKHYEKELNKADPTKGPTSYEIADPDALRRVVDPALLPRDSGYGHWKTAVQNLREYNDPEKRLTPEARAALKRLQALGNNDRCFPDVIFKIFLDIDEVFFFKKLRDNVFLYWVLEPDADAVAWVTLPGKNPYSAPRVSIAINGSHITAPVMPLHDIIMILIHESIHAYLRVCCDGRSKKDIATVDRRTDEPNPGHGTSFKLCLEAIQARLGPTRFTYMAITGGQAGGTVPIGTELRHHWDVNGSFMLEDEREELAFAEGSKMETAKVLKGIDAGGLERSKDDERDCDLRSRKEKLDDLLEELQDLEDEDAMWKAGRSGRQDGARYDPGDRYGTRPDERQSNRPSGSHGGLFGRRGADLCDTGEYSTRFPREYGDLLTDRHGGLFGGRGLDFSDCEENLQEIPRNYGDRYVGGCRDDYLGRSGRYL